MSNCLFPLNARSTCFSNNNNNNNNNRKNICSERERRSDRWIERETVIRSHCDWRAQEKKSFLVIVECCFSMTRRDLLNVSKNIFLRDDATQPSKTISDDRERQGPSASDGLTRFAWRTLVEGRVYGIDRWLFPSEFGQWWWSGPERSIDRNKVSFWLKRKSTNLIE